MAYISVAVEYGGRKRDDDVSGRFWVLGGSSQHEQ